MARVFGGARAGWQWRYAPLAALAIVAGCHRVAPPELEVREVVAAPGGVPHVASPPRLVTMDDHEHTAAGWLLVPALRPPAPAPAARPFWPPMPLGAAECRARCVLVVSTPERTLTLVHGSDTLFEAPAAVASGVTLVQGGRSWTFRTPPGERRVLRKVVNPVWTPPDWHYAEAARDHGLRLVNLPAGGTMVSGGRRLEIRGGVVGIVRPGEPFRALPSDEHVVFDGRLFVPPVGTRNRRLHGDLGRYALDLGDGYMIHGTPYQASIGRATTHGCIRLRDTDIAWLYEHVPMGTRVVIR